MQTMGFCFARISCPVGSWLKVCFYPSFSLPFLWTPTFFSLRRVKANRKKDTLSHELIHAYDHSRFHLSTTSLRHQACTEIRASLLSGECRFGREVLGRGQWKFTKQMQECVRRRAVLSLMNRPQISEGIKLVEGEKEGGVMWEVERRKKAESIIDGVWESCANDTRPFDEVYR